MILSTWLQLKRWNIVYCRTLTLYHDKVKIKINYALQEKLDSCNIILNFGGLPGLFEQERMCYDSRKNETLCKNNSAIRMMFEEGNRLRAIYGADKVYDFSLGNPSVPAPECVKEAIIDLVNEVEPTVLHGYMSNAGFEDVRQTIAESLNRRFGTKFAAKNLIMTVGAASGLNVIFKTILNPEEEVIVFCTILFGIRCICA